MASKSSTGRVAKGPAKQAAGKPRHAAKPVAAVKASVPKGRAETAGRPLAKAEVEGAEVKVALRLRELIDRVAGTAGVKRKDAKPVIEATLKHLGDALGAGESLILQPLGRLRVNRTKVAASGDTLTVKLRRPAGSKTAGKPHHQGLAEDGE